MGLAISPKLLRHQDGKLYAYRGINEIAFLFGNQIRVAPVIRSFGPFHWLGRDFFETFEVYRPARENNGG